MTEHARGDMPAGEAFDVVHVERPGRSVSHEEHLFEHPVTVMVSASGAVSFSSGGFYVGFGPGTWVTYEVKNGPAAIRRPADPLQGRRAAAD